MMAKGDAHSGEVLPPSLKADLRGDIAVLWLDRAEKRNALNDETIRGIGWFFETLPAAAKVVIIASTGPNFSAGLDLSEVIERDVVSGIAHSRMWHRTFEAIEFGRVPVISVVNGAVVGGGLELAAATHIRVAEKTAYYALPEGQRGIFVGGGASVRVPRLIGTHRMMDMMLTGRVYDAEMGQQLGISHYLSEAGQGFELALTLAAKIAANAPITNYAVMHVLPRIAAAEPAQGYMMESLMAAVAETSDDARLRLRAFLEKRAKKVTEF
jgi:(methylthio)acryloyl-CoA hydratase